MAAKIKKEPQNFCNYWDGEINEGSIWESVLLASKHKLSNLKVLLDYNKIQSYGFTREVVDLEPREKNGVVLALMFLK